MTASGTVTASGVPGPQLRGRKLSPRVRAAIAAGVFFVILAALMAKIVLDPESTGVMVEPDRDSVAQPDQVQRVRGGQYAFLQTQPDSTDPVTYDRCKPIDVIIGTRTGPENAAEIVRAGLEEITERSGLRFTVVQTTDAPLGAGEPKKTGDAWDPVLISWTDDKAEPELAGRVLGRGGSLWVEQGGTRWYVSGQVLLDGPDLATLGEAETRATVLHELAHLIGLHHVDDRSELMYPITRQLDWGPGDLAGLAELGKGTCR